MKHCRKCSQDKPLADFGRDKQKPDGRTYSCKSCLASIRRDPGKHRGADFRYRLRRKYNLSLEDYQEILAEQDYRCGICRCTEAEAVSKTGRGFCVDHDHNNERVRGLLCGNCNRGIGLLGDSYEGLKAAASYLTK